MQTLIRFFIEAIAAVFTGSKRYFAWLGVLVMVMMVAGYAYGVQFTQGLQVTGLHDHVSWGFYVGNFAFFVGIAAGTVVLLIPSFVLRDKDFSKAALPATALGLSAVLVALFFVVVDLGGIMRVWHALPGIGHLNFPHSMLSWDMLFLNGFLALNLVLVFSLLFSQYLGMELYRPLYIPLVFFTIFWAIGMQMVEAFLQAGLSGMPFWNSALLGPRYLAAALTASPALIILLFSAIRKLTGYSLGAGIFKKLPVIMMFAAYINLIMLGSEMFKEFYLKTEHSMSAQYLFFGLHGHNELVPYIWSSITMNLLATAAISLRRVRESQPMLIITSLILFFAIWLEKSMCVVVPGFIPSSLGEMVEYRPQPVELMVGAGVVAFGFFMFTAIMKVAIGVERGEIHAKARG